MDPDISTLSYAETAELARRAGLRQVGTRPALGAYVKDLWDRRGFLWTLSSAKSTAKNEGQRLGQLWSVINPLLLIATYFFIFGLVLNTTRGVDNFVGFLSVGVILFSLSASTMTSGSRAILNNAGLVRALHFPRAILPLSTVLTECLALLPGLGVLLVILPLTGEWPRWSWLLFPVAFLLQAMMQAGVVLILARLINASADLWNFIPVGVRLLRYMSGVFFSVAATMTDHPIVGGILTYQPWALQLSLAREALLGEFPLDPTTWLVGLGWAIVLPVVGLVVFWRDEGRYGRG